MTKAVDLSEWQDSLGGGDAIERVSLERTLVPLYIPRGTAFHTLEKNGCVHLSTSAPVPKIYQWLQTEIGKECSCSTQCSAQLPSKLSESDYKLKSSFLY